MDLKKLKKARDSVGHNLNEVAVETGVSYVTLQHAEKGIAPKKLKTLKPILDYINKYSPSKKKKTTK